MNGLFRLTMGPQAQPEASSSRVTLDRKRRAHGDRREGRSGQDKEREREWRAKRVRKRSEVENEQTWVKRRLREEDEGGRTSTTAKKGAQMAQERERSPEREAADDEDGGFLPFRPAVVCGRANEGIEELPMRPLPKALKRRRDAARRSAEREVVEDVDGLQPQPQSPYRGKASSKRTFAGECQPDTTMLPILN